MNRRTRRYQSYTTTTSKLARTQPDMAAALRLGAALHARPSADLEVPHNDTAAADYFIAYPDQEGESVELFSFARFHASPGREGALQEALK